VFKAISEGCTSFEAIAICGGKMGEELSEYAYPCGICRQVLAEFAGPDFPVIVAKSVTDHEIHRLDDLLRYSFGRENME
jgi:cytidine deaminase